MTGAGPREAARARLKVLSVLGSAGSVAIAGLVAGATAQAYSARLRGAAASPRSAPHQDVPAAGALTDLQLLATDFSLPLAAPTLFVIHVPAGAGGGAAPRVLAPQTSIRTAAGTAPVIAPAAAPRPAPKPASGPPPPTTGVS